MSLIQTGNFVTSGAFAYLEHVSAASEVQRAKSGVELATLKQDEVGAEPVVSHDASEHRILSEAVMETAIPVHSEGEKVDWEPPALVPGDASMPLTFVQPGRLQPSVRATQTFALQTWAGTVKPTTTTTPSPKDMTFTPQTWGVGTNNPAATTLSVTFGLQTASGIRRSAGNSTTSFPPAQLTTDTFMLQTGASTLAPKAQ